MGLTLLSGILRAAGHQVIIVDYSYLSDVGMKPGPPSVRELILRYAPDVIGISVFTFLYFESNDLIDEIRRVSDVPIVIGGPHVSIFPSDFRENTNVDYIVRGEAESSILNVIETAKRERTVVSIETHLPSADAIPEADLDAVLGREHLSNYQLQLSRGCPYECSFCNVPKLIAGRKVRKRNIGECVEQIRRAKKRYPSIDNVIVTDDCPAVDRRRFMSFLDLMAKARLNCTLEIDNMRADAIDDEMIDLYVAAGGRNVCLGVESGNPDVFGGIGKGESLADIERAAEIVRRKGLLLGCCFVIGLPGDNIDRHMDSIRFAKRLKPDYAFWNMCLPWPGTSVGAWYERNGMVGDLRGVSTLIDHEGKFDMPPAATEDFPVEQRIRAWLLANLATYSISWRGLPRLLSAAPKYGLNKSFFKWVIGYVPFVLNVKRRLSWQKYLGNVSAR